MARNTPESDDTLSLSFLDVICCSLGASLFLFFVLSVLPHVGSITSLERPRDADGLLRAQAIGTPEEEENRLLAQSPMLFRLTLEEPYAAERPLIRFSDDLDGEFVRLYRGADSEGRSTFLVVVVPRDGNDKPPVFDVEPAELLAGKSLAFSYQLTIGGRELELKHRECQALPTAAGLPFLSVDLRQGASDGAVDLQCAS